MTSDIGDVIRCQNCGSQSRSISQGCSQCGHGMPVADLSDIPAEAVELAARASFVRQSDLDSLSDVGKNIELHQARRMLAAALPVLNTARDAETAARLAKIWPDPFGHWTAEEAEAARAMKRALLSHLPLSDRDTEHAELASLRTEVAELRRRDAEYTASLGGEQR